MKSLHDLCKPRDSVFDPQKRDTVRDLTDLVDDRIDPNEFFAENYITEGMKTLLEHGMRRFEGKTDQGVFKLKQAMGGGKTHNLLALGLLARYPEFRTKVMGGFYKPDASLAPVKVIAFTQAYAKAIRSAKQMAITSESPEEFANRVTSAYPFHPGIRDLYARFRENQGFQQTRGLIRLMRIVAAGLWKSGEDKSRMLISAHDLDLNDQETRAEIGQINNTLDNAIAHDIASDGSAIAEAMDTNLGSKDATDACKLLLMSSLANVPNAVLGLSLPELVAYLCEPGRDLSRLKSDVLEKLSTAACYLQSTRDGKLFFKNVQNLIAKLEGLVKTYASEQAVKELKSRLERLFKPANGWCHQKVQILPPLDEIEPEQDKTTLVVMEPHPGSALKAELQAFFDQATWKNRIAYLTGTKDTYDSLIDVGKRLKAIQYILDELKADKVPDNDPQMIQANDLSDKTQQNFHYAVRETFTTLWYPTESGLTAADFRMKFEANKYNGEQQVIDVLKEKMKFTEDVSGDTFRKKCEQRLFTQQSMPWNEIKRRVATAPK